MSFIRTADEPRIPLRGVFMYLLAGGLGVRYCAPFPPQHVAPVHK